jgi:hypothetical protein
MRSVSKNYSLWDRRASIQSTLNNRCVRTCCSLVLWSQPTEWYVVAKIAAIKLCEAYRRQHGDDFISVMPTNMYGPNDNYHPLNSHVPAALVRRFHEAKLNKTPVVTVWGSGKPRREFIAADDAADAFVFVMKNYSDTKFLNVGTGSDVTVGESHPANGRQSPILPGFHVRAMAGFTRRRRTKRRCFIHVRHARPQSSTPIGPRRNLCDAQNHPRSRGNRIRPSGKDLSWKSRCQARLGARTRLC